MIWQEILTCWKRSFVANTFNYIFDFNCSMKGKRSLNENRKRNKKLWHSKRPKSKLPIWSTSWTTTRRINTNFFTHWKKYCMTMRPGEEPKKLHILRCIYKHRSDRKVESTWSLIRNYSLPVSNLKPLSDQDPLHRLGMLPISVTLSEVPQDPSIQPPRPTLDRLQVHIRPTTLLIPVQPSFPWETIIWNTRRPVELPNIFTWPQRPNKLVSPNEIVHPPVTRGHMPDHHPQPILQWHPCTEVAA